MPKWFAEKLPYTISKYGMSLVMHGIAEEFRGQTKVDVLVEYCREKLVHYKVPRRIACISALPRNLAGKIDKRRLRQDAQDILGITAA